MSTADYEICETHVLASEGGYSNNPSDPGGPTNWGITIYDARLYWKHNATPADVKAMPKAVAQDIYRKKYWDALDCDDLLAGLDYTVFDYGVNSGVARAGAALRRSMGFGAADWHVTPEVVAMLGKRDIKMLIAEINDERLAFLRNLRTWPTFGRGWSTRVASVKALSLAMAGAAVPPPVAPPAPVAKGVDHPSSLLAHLAASSWDVVKGALIHPAA